jgi:hypothetical protein
MKSPCNLYILQFENAILIHIVLRKVSNLEFFAEGRLTLSATLTETVAALIRQCQVCTWSKQSVNWGISYCDRFIEIQFECFKGAKCMFHLFDNKLPWFVCILVESCMKYLKEIKNQALNIGRSRALSDPFVKLSDVERKPPEILSDLRLSETEVYCLSDPSVLVSDQTVAL